MSIIEKGKQYFEEAQKPRDGTFAENKDFRQTKGIIKQNSFF